MKTERLTAPLIFFGRMTIGQGTVFRPYEAWEFTADGLGVHNGLLRAGDLVAFTPNRVTGMAEDIQPVDEIRAKPPSAAYLRRDAARRKAGRPRLSIVA